MERLNKLSVTAQGFISIVVVFSLLSSFGLHAVQVPHEHFAPFQAHGGHGHGEEKRSFGWQTIEAAFHTSDKKLYLVFLGSSVTDPAFLEVVSALSLLLFVLYAVKLIYESHGRNFRVFDYTHWYLRKGIFHSKAY